jgi:hypothetical protein
VPPRAKPDPPAADPAPEPLEPREDSPGSSEDSSGSEPVSLLADPGPEFDPDQADRDAAERDSDRILTASPGGDTGVVVEWELDTIRSLLEAAGSSLHGVAGKAEHDWEFTRTELAAISKPLTRILNRYDATRVAAATGDEIALILGLLGYTMRSLQERKAAIAAQQPAPETTTSPASAGIPQPPIEEAPFQ